MEAVNWVRNLHLISCILDCFDSLIIRYNGVNCSIMKRVFAINNLIVLIKSTYSTSFCCNTVFHNHRQTFRSWSCYRHNCVYVWIKSYVVQYWRYGIRKKPMRIYRVKEYCCKTISGMCSQSTIVLTCRKNL